MLRFGEERRLVCLEYREGGEGVDEEVGRKSKIGRWGFGGYV